MQLQQLEYLRLVVEKGSYAAAARARGVSQPAVTQAMQALERELGVTLFQRIGRRNVPTAAALSVAQHAAEVRDSLSALEPHRAADHAATHAAAAKRAPPALHLGMSAAAALLYGPTIQKAWHGREPEGILHFTSSGAPEMLAGLAGNALDLVIAPRPRRYQVAGIRQMLLHTSRPVVYCRKGHPLQGARSLADIAGAAWAVTGRTGTPGNVIEEALKVRGAEPPRILMHCTDYSTLLHMVSQTDLLCVIPHPALLAMATPPAVRPMRIREGLPQYEVGAFWRRTGGRPSARHVEHVVQALAAAFPQRG